MVNELVASIDPNRFEGDVELSQIVFDPTKKSRHLKHRVGDSVLVFPHPAELPIRCSLRQGCSDELLRPKVSHERYRLFPRVVANRLIDQERPKWESFSETCVNIEDGLSDLCNRLFGKRRRREPIRKIHP